MFSAEHNKLTCKLYIIDEAADAKVDVLGV